MHRDDFALRLAEGVAKPAETLRTYVVTPQLATSDDGILRTGRPAKPSRLSASRPLARSSRNRHGRPRSTRSRRGSAMQLRPDGRLLRHDGLQDGDRVRRADLIKTPAHERTAVPSREHSPGFRSEALPRSRRADMLTRLAERRDPRRPRSRGRVSPAACHLTIRERRPARLGKPDVRIPAEPQVAVPPSMVSRWTQRRLCLPGSTTRKSVRHRCAVRLQGADLFGSASSCHPGPGSRRTHTDRHGTRSAENTSANRLLII